jgi:hypothetical protein
MVSGLSAKKSDMSVNFNLTSSHKEAPTAQEYDIPTLKRLNPELYKEYL